MKYQPSFFIRALSKLGYNVKNFSFADTIEMDPLDALRYAIISDSGYLKVDEIEKRLILRRDYFRILNQVENGEIQTGLFHGNQPSFFNTAQTYINKYDFIMKEKKYIVFLNYDENLRNGEPPFFDPLIRLNDSILFEGLNPNDFIVTLVPLKKAKDLESFFEYYICEYYRTRGYFVDSQLPFYYGVGTPDIGIASCQEITDLFNYLGVTGMSIVDLMLLPYIVKKGNTLACSNKTIVFEVKTTTKNGSQIKKYIAKNIFDDSYEVIPHKQLVSDYTGLINFEESGNMTIQKNNTIIYNTENKQAYLDWLLTYMKAYLITSLNNCQFELFKSKHLINDTYSLLDFLKSRTLVEIVKEMGF